MSLLALRGLFRDSILQVLDNRVFRVLVILTLVPILATFVIGLGEERVSLLFGLKTLDYPDFMWAVADGVSPRAYIVELFRSIFVESIVGSVGLTICIAATSFFVPEMVQKGAADLVFTKPLPRWALYLSRYVTGLVFIGALGLVLNAGIFLGLGLRSGYWYPGFLWSTLTLVYIFGLIHGVTMLIGLVTKSTPAAMILGIMFFSLNGCVHGTWMFVDGFGSQLDAMTTAPESEDEAEREEADKWDALKTFGKRALDTAHFALPKTTEAPMLLVLVQDAVGYDDSLAIRTAFSDHELERARESNQESVNGELQFQKRFSFDAEEPRYNAWVSLLSSLAFVGVVLAIGFWLLGRMDL